MEVSRMTKLLMLVAFGAGYIAGAHAGRARYDQIRALTMRVKNDPRVRERAHEAAGHVREHLPGVNGHREPDPYPAGL
jgi:hypothetical protein